MDTFRQRWAEILAQEPLSRGRTIVFGEGRADAPRLCLIGEAPGAQEEAQGRPFVGKAGQNLNAFLAAIGLRREDMWVTNVVKLRPCRISARGTVSNRPPSAGELALFAPMLAEELALVRPEIVVTLGNTPLRAVLGPKETIGERHGVPLIRPDLAFTLFPLYHPASVLYNRALQAVYEADVGKLREYLDT